MPSSAEPAALRATERWFMRRGLPMLVEEYSAGTDVWTRALPALVAGFVLLLASVQDQLQVSLLAGDPGPVVLSATLSGGVELLRLLAVVVVLLAAFAGLNLLRGRRPFARPHRVGTPLLVAFVAVPVAYELVASRSVAAAAGILVLALVLLALIYVFSRYALFALLWWVVRWTFTQLGDVYRLSTRALPLLLLFITFLFVNTEVWQVAGTMDVQVLWGSLGVFALLGVLFLAGRVAGEVDGIEVATDRAGVLDALVGGPLEGLADGLPDLDEPVPLSRQQRANIGLVLVTAQLIQAALIGLIVWAFFIVFGSLAINVQVQTTWLAGLGDVDWVVQLGDRNGITRPLLRVATFLGGFAAFYAMVYAASDQVYRAHFVDRIGRYLSRTLAVRRAYLAARRAAGLSAPVPRPAGRGPNGGPGAPPHGGPGPVDARTLLR